jgi:hypothetical protein
MSGCFTERFIYVSCITVHHLQLHLFTCYPAQKRLTLGKQQTRRNKYRIMYIYSHIHINTHIRNTCVYKLIYNRSCERGRFWNMAFSAGFMLLTRKVAADICVNFNVFIFAFFFNFPY